MHSAFDLTPLNRRCWQPTAGGGSRQSRQSTRLYYSQWCAIENAGVSQTAQDRPKVLPQTVADNVVEPVCPLSVSFTFFFTGHLCVASSGLGVCACLHLLRG